MVEDWRSNLEPVEEPEPEKEPEISQSGSGLPVKAVVFFWFTIVSGIAIGTLLFLFFINIFIYFFLPIATMYLVWQLLKRLTR